MTPEPAMSMLDRELWLRALVASWSESASTRACSQQLQFVLDRTEPERAEIDVLRKRIEFWRGRVQFVYLGGGPPDGTDEELFQRLCETHDAEVKSLKAALQVSDGDSCSWRASVAAPGWYDAGCVPIKREHLAVLKDWRGCPYCQKPLSLKPSE